MPRKPLRQRIAEMISVDDSPLRRMLFGFARYGLGNNVWSQIHIAETNYERPNYNLTRAIYHNSIVNGEGAEYLLAAALGKPIVNVIAGFVAGRGFKIELDNPNNDANITSAEEDINAWVDENGSDLYDFLRFGYRDGDSYVHLDELCNVTLLDAEGVEVILDPVSGRLKGYDVIDRVRVLIPGYDPNAKTNRVERVYYYLRRYRTDSIQIIQYENMSALGNDQGGTVLYQKVYTVNGAVNLAGVDSTGQPVGSSTEEDNVSGTDPNGDADENAYEDDTVFNPADIVEQALPVLHFANEPDPKAVYGTSEYQNVLALFQNYASILSGGTKNVIYNSTPIPVIKGVTDTDAFEADANDSMDASDQEAYANSPGSGTTMPGLDWSNQKVLYIDGQNADAKFLQATGVVADAVLLLEYYFFLMVQGSETPEFSLGTGVASSKASTDSQMPVLIKKIERKQKQATKVLRKLIRVYMEKQTLLSNVAYLNMDIENIRIAVNFPAIDDEDLTLTLAVVTFALQSGIMTKKTALEMIANGRVKDIDEEVKAAAKEAAADTSANAATNQDRLISQILGPKPAPAPGDVPTPDPNAAADTGQGGGVPGNNIDSGSE